MSLEKLSRDDMIVGGVGLLAVISLLFFPWYHVSVAFGLLHASYSYSGTSDPDGWLGVLAMLCVLAVVVDLAVERFSPGTAVPAIQDSRQITRFVLAAAAGAFVVLKLLLHLNHLSWGFVIDVLAVGGLVYLTFKARAVTAPAPPVTTA
jgi:hypothetical protein